MFKVLQIDHIGIAVKDEHAIAKFLTEAGVAFCGSEMVAEQQVSAAIYDIAGVRIELLAATVAESPIAKFIEQKGGGIHHIALRVDNLEAALAYFASRGYPLIDDVPRLGVGGKLIAFLHPKATGGILIELSQVVAGTGKNASPVKTD